MGKVTNQRTPKKIVVLTITAICLIAVLYFIARSAVSYQKGFSWAEMDWNQDGSTSISEFFTSSDIDTRPIKKKGKDCVEYYYYKDGLTVKIVCPE